MANMSLAEKNSGSELSARPQLARSQKKKQLVDTAVRQTDNGSIIAKKKARGKAFEKGYSGNKAGRPSGPSNRITRFAIKNRYELAKAGITPLEFMLNVVRDPKMHVEYRLEAAKAAAPYIHKRMPIAIEGGDPNKPILFDMGAISKLGATEKFALLTMLDKLGLPQLESKAGQTFDAVLTDDGDKE